MVTDFSLHDSRDDELDDARPAGVGRAGRTGGPIMTPSLTRADARLAKVRAKQGRKASAADSKQYRAASKAEAKAAKAARKAAKAEAKAVAAAAKAAKTRPTRIFDRLTDPKNAKRAVSVGKIVVPALAPVALAATASARGCLDRRRARDLGVPAEKVAQYRGPTGPTGARIDGLRSSLDSLTSRKGGDQQVTRFAETARARLDDLTAAVQAAASMRRSKRRQVLRAVGRELTEMESDVVGRLLPSDRVALSSTE
jgi:hypothetical protein